VEVISALDAAQALVAALDLRYGEIVVQVSDDGRVKVIRLARTLLPAHLAELRVPDVSSS
jgi:hypothetical protein